MIRIFTILIVAMISSSVSCTKMGQRIAYGKTVTNLPTLHTPTSTVDVVNQAVDVAKVAEMQQERLNQQKRLDLEVIY